LARPSRRRCLQDPGYRAVHDAYTVLAEADPVLRPSIDLI